MPDRTINFGESEAEATYQIQDTDGAAGGGNFVVAKDTNANTVLLQYNPSMNAWEYAGDVDMGGSDITNANAIESTTVDSDAVGTPTIIDTEDGTNYDVGDQLVGFGDADGNGTYELPNATDGIDVGSVNTDAIDSKSGYTDRTSERSLGLWQQNTTGRDLEVTVIVNADADATDVRITADVNDSKSANKVDEYRDTIDEFDRASVSMTVPNTFYYQVRDAGEPANFSLDTWVEQ